MKRHILVATLCVLACFSLVVGSSGEARPRPAGRGKAFTANKTFGLGLMLGAPTGLSGKYYLSSNKAIDFGVGAYYRYRYRSALHVFADYLWHPLTLASVKQFELPFYFGIGGRLLQHGDGDDRYNDGTHLGVRVPAGVAMDFNRVPFDVFFELALHIDIIADDDHGTAGLGAAVGARYYFE